MHSIYTLHTLHTFNNSYRCPIKHGKSKVKNGTPRFMNTKSFFLFELNPVYIYNSTIFKLAELLYSKEKAKNVCLKCQIVIKSHSLLGQGPNG